MFGPGAHRRSQPASAGASREEALEVACGADADAGSDQKAEERYWMHCTGQHALCLTFIFMRCDFVDLHGLSLSPCKYAEQCSNSNNDKERKISWHTYLERTYPGHMMIRAPLPQNFL